MNQTPNSPQRPMGLLTDDANSWYSQGESLANLGQHREALDCFERVLAIDPTHVQSWVFQAVELLHLERHTTALESCNRAIALNPTNKEAWTFRGVALQRLKRYQEAYDSYQHAVDLEYVPIHNAFWDELGYRIQRRLSSISLLWRIAFRPPQDY